MAIASDQVSVRKSRIFFPAMHLVMVGMTAVGFGPLFYLRSEEHGPLSPYLLVHGLVMTAWMAVSLVQSALPGLGHLKLHRKLGWAGVVLAVAVLVTGLMAILSSIKANRFPVESGFASAANFSIVPVRDLVTFASLVVLGLLWRRTNSEAHKRAMLLATVTLMSATLGRLTIGLPQPLPIFAGVVGLIAAMIVFDLRSRGRPHPVSLWGGLILIASFAVAQPLGMTPAWGELMARFA